MSELEAGAGTSVPDVPTATEAAQPQPTVNIPLSGDQKFVLRSIQTRLANFAKAKLELDVQIARFEGILQLEMMKMAHSNAIDMDKFALSDTLDIVPKPPEPKQNPFGGQVPPRR